MGRGHFLLKPIPFEVVHSRPLPLLRKLVFDQLSPTTGKCRAAISISFWRATTRRQTARELILGIISPIDGDAFDTGRGGNSISGLNTDRRGRSFGLPRPNPSCAKTQSPLLVARQPIVCEVY